MLTREQIDALNDVEIVSVEVPEWKGQVFIRSLDAAGREAMAARLDKEKAKPNSKVSTAGIIVAAVLCDHAGRLLYGDEDGPAILSKRNTRALDRIIKAAKGLNGFGDDEVKAAAKNS